MTNVMTKEEIMEAVEWMANSGLINSGALVALDPEMLEIEVVAASAATHVYPEYEYAAESPRVYGNFSQYYYRDVWLAWTCSVLTGELWEPPLAYDRKEWREKVIQRIQRAMQEINV